MSDTPTTPPDEPKPPRAFDATDWFLPAIAAEGNVASSLSAVLERTAQRSAFIAVLLKQLCRPTSEGPLDGRDRLTTLEEKIRHLENTLRFRLGLLSPEREGAWFREPVSRSGGPFSSDILSEPVFAHYEASEARRIEAALNAAWRNKTLGPIPFTHTQPCLWLTLLKLNYELESIVKLASPFGDLRLDHLPDDLPEVLESVSLRAYLINVRGLVLKNAVRLEECFKFLTQGCKPLWQKQLGATAETRENARKGSPAAESFRAEQSKRRRDSRRFFLTPKVQESLHFMGFDAVPEADALKKRYLQLAKKLHPDLQGGSDDSFKELNRAYSYLTEQIR